MEGNYLISRKPHQIFAPIALIYGAIIRVRNFLYDHHFLTIHPKPDGVKIISIGNIIAGGSGKTPFTIYLSQLLQKNGYRLCVLSRGYGRKSKGVQLVSDGENILLTPEDAGEEPFLIASSLPGIPVGVSENRYEGVQKLVSRFHPEIIIMDDAFQHRKMERDLDIVLHPCFSDPSFTRLLPAGYLREPFSSLGRADCILFTKGSPAECNKQKENLLRKYPHFANKFIHYVTYRNDTVEVFEGDAGFRPVTQIPTDPFVAISGIAHPDTFEDSLIRAGIRFEKHLRYEDHHHYTSGDWERIQKFMQKLNTNQLITTMKDFIKLKPFLHSQKGYQIFVLKIQVRLSDESGFLRFILQSLNL